MLIQSALSTVPIYTMQSLALPVGVCKEIDKICRDFLWGETDDKKWPHPMKWSDVCTPQDKGGLGLRMARYFNLAQPQN